MRHARIVAAVLALTTACASPDRLTAPVWTPARQNLAADPSVQTFQIGMRVFVGVCAVPTLVVQIPLEGTVQWVVRTIAFDNGVRYGVHTNLQGLKGTLPDGSSVVAIGSSNSIDNDFDLLDPSSGYTATFVKKLYLVQPGSGIVYGTSYLYKVTITPNGATTVSLSSIDTGLPSCI